MTRLADTVAAELAQQAWLGVDAPGVISPAGIRRALEVLPGNVSLEDVLEWARPALVTIVDAADVTELEGRFAGAIAAALILGAQLHATEGT